MTNVAPVSSQLSASAEAMNKRIAGLLTKFGMNGERILADARKDPPSAQSILKHPALVNESGLIRLNMIGTMDAMLEVATKGKPAISLPKDPKVGLQALTFFLRLNQTPELSWREKDTPHAWSTRIIDVLFRSLAQKKVLSHAEFIALERISQNQIWLSLFAYALDLFLTAIADPKRVASLDKVTSQAAVMAFRSAAEARHARLPKVKYGNPHVNSKDIAEYAIGEYLAGLDVNEALARTLVQAQLGMDAEGGKEQFQSFLSKNSITPDTFPTTINILYDTVNKLMRFQETEGEVAAVCYTYAQETQQTGKVERIFAAFADAIFPLAAKCRRQFSLGPLSPAEGAQIIARWAGRSVALSDMRKGGLSRQVSLLIPFLSRNEKSALFAFRDGRTESRSIDPQDVAAYVRTRCKLLTLGAQQAKIQRIEELIRIQVSGAEQFIMRPGQAFLQDMTYGVEVFFRALRNVFDDICMATGSQMRDQTMVLGEFQRRYGPLSVVALLVPMQPGTTVDVWIKEARTALQNVAAASFSE